LSSFFQFLFLPKNIKEIIQKIRKRKILYPMVLMLVWKYIQIHQHERIHPKINKTTFPINSAYVISIKKKTQLTAIVEQVNRFV